MKRLLPFIAIFGLIFVLAACSQEEPDPDLLHIGNTVEGRKVFNSGGSTQIPCASCHSLDGTRSVGPSMQGMADRAEASVEGLSAEEYLRESLLKPGAFVVSGYDDVMNDIYGQELSPEEINNLVAYLLSQ